MISLWTFKTQFQGHFLRVAFLNRLFKITKSSGFTLHDTLQLSLLEIIYFSMLIWFLTLSANKAKPASLWLPPLSQLLEVFALSSPLSVCMRPKCTSPTGLGRPQQAASWGSSHGPTARGPRVASLCALYFQKGFRFPWDHSTHGRRKTTSRWIVWRETSVPSVLPKE